jgi:Pectate lyase superfamily protein/Immunoglobulin I-set domain
MATTARVSIAFMLAASLGAALGGCNYPSADGGNAATSNGAVSNTADAPNVVSQPNSLSVNAGQSAKFSVTASGTGLSYQWRMNSSAISGATAASYSIASASASRAGTYTVVVSNAVGSVTSADAQLSVNDLTQNPPIIHSTHTLLSVPQSIKTSGHQNDPLVYAGYLDVTLYGADPTGKADSTAAFQNAMLDASGNSTNAVGNSMLVYVPSGTYLISNTITGYQSCSGGSPASNAGYGSIEKYGGVSAPGLVGPGSGPRPTIVLKDHTFTNSGSPQPMIHMVNSPNAGAGGCGGQYAGSAQVGAFDILFNAVVRDINITTGNNPGAIGVQFYSAQKSYMQNVLVNATNGYIGLQGAPATDTWTNVEVRGGQYGVWIDKTAGVSAIAGLTLENQSVAGIYFNAIGDLALSGFDIQETNPAATAIVAGGLVAQGSTISLVDGIISTTSAGQAAISNLGDDGLYLNDVYMQAPKVLINNDHSTTIAASGTMQLIGEYSHADQGTNADSTSNPGGYALASSSVVNDSLQIAADFGPIYSTAGGTPPTDLVIRHLPGQMPWAFDANALWVTDYGADPTGFKDSTAQIQNAIDAAHAGGSDEVFLPRGDYSISATLKLYPNTKFFGLPGLYSQLLGYGWVTHHTLQPFLQVGDAVGDAAATEAGHAIVSDIAIQLPSDATSYAAYAKLLPNGGANYDPADQTYLYAVEWQTGRSSVSNQFSISYQSQGNITDRTPVPTGDILITPATRNLVLLDHSGGGRWYGLQIAGGSFNSPTGNSLYATGTSMPLSIYGSNIEHAAGASFYGFSNASNIRVLGTKTESGAAPYWFTVDNSNNIMLSGLTAHQNSSVMVNSSTNVNLNAMDFYSMYPAEAQTVSFITDDRGSYNSLAAYALFKLNQPGTNGFNNSVFPHCGDNVCDGGETPENCPADCGSGT